MARAPLARERSRAADPTKMNRHEPRRRPTSPSILQNSISKPPKKLSPRKLEAATPDDSRPRLRRRALSDARRPANTAELLKFLIDRTGYIKQLEEEDTPEAFSRVENLHELVNAAMDSRDRGETLDQFLDHAALVSDADAYDERAQITLMTLHAAKGLEFPLVFLCGLEEGLFPHSRTFLHPDDIEEERRLCYVGMTRAMGTLMLTRARLSPPLRHRLPEASVPSRFLEEVPRRAAGRIGNVAPHGPRGTGLSPVRAERSSAVHSDITTPTKTKTNPPSWTRARKPARSHRRAQVQLHRQHRRVLRLARQKIQRSPKLPVEAAARARKDSAPARRSAIPNTAKAPSISAKEKVKRPRLRYNSLASV